MTINGGKGNDTVFNFNESSLLHVTNGNIASAVLDGTDVVLNIGSGSVKLNGMAGRNFSIKGANGDVSSTVIGDILYATTEGSTVDNSTDGKIIKIVNDNIVLNLKGSKQIVDYAKGSNLNLTITGYDADDTLRFDWEEYDRTVIKGNDIVIPSRYEEGGKITNIVSPDSRSLYVMPGGATIADNSEINYVENRTDGVSINLGNSVEEFYNTADNVTVKAAGNTSINHRAGSNVSIKAGDGDDDIYANEGEGNSLFKNNVTIDAGDGNNEIEFDGTRYGNDYVFHSKNLKIKAGAGNDYIGFYRVDKVSVDVGDGNNIVEVYGNGEGANQNVTIKSGAGNDYINANEYGEKPAEVKNYTMLAGEIDNVWTVNRSNRYDVIALIELGIIDSTNGIIVLHDSI